MKIMLSLLFVFVSVPSFAVSKHDCAELLRMRNEGVSPQTARSVASAVDEKKGEKEVRAVDKRDEKHSKQIPNDAKKIEKKELSLDEQL